MAERDIYIPPTEPNRASDANEVSGDGIQETEQEIQGGITVPTLPVPEPSAAATTSATLHQAGLIKKKLEKPPSSANRNDGAKDVGIGATTGRADLRRTMEEHQAKQATARSVQVAARSPESTTPIADASDSHERDTEDGMNAANKGQPLRGLHRTTEEHQAKQAARSVGPSNNGQPLRGLRRTMEEQQAKQATADAVSTSPAPDTTGNHSEAVENINVDGSARMTQMRGLRKNNDSRGINEATVIETGGRGNTQRGLRKNRQISQDLLPATLQETSEQQDSVQEASDQGSSTEEQDQMGEDEGNSQEARSENESGTSEEEPNQASPMLEQVHLPGIYNGTEAFDRTVSETHPSQETGPDNVDLAIALPVDDEEDVSSLMEAQQVSPQEVERMKIKKQKEQQCRRIGFGIIISCCTILAVALGLHFTRGNDGAPLEIKPTDSSPTLEPSDHPSEAPTGVFDLLMDNLPNHTLASLQNSSTPQWKARTWLEGHPDLSNMPLWRQKQLLALVTFYHSMEGQHWPKDVKDNWLQHSDECFWFSSTFGGFTDEMAPESYVEGGYGKADNMTICNEQGKYETLFLRENLGLSNMTSIPPEIAFLESLIVLQVGEKYSFVPVDTSMDAFLATEIYRMTKLKRLTFNGNSLTGPIPIGIGLMTSLQSLYFDSNDLTGPLPSQIGMMHHLEDLYLHSNTLTGQIPNEIGLMTALQSVELSYNQLAGAFPSEIGLLTDLKHLSLNTNALTGRIPSEIGLLTVLYGVYFARNQLTGAVPTEIGLLHLTDLNLEWNALTGYIPSEVGLLTALKNVDFSGNRFIGTVPTEIGLLASMRFLRPSINALTGWIPSEIGLLANLEYLRFNDNWFTGTLPTEIGLLASLTDLWLHNNELSGGIPSEIGLLTDMEKFYINDNQFSGTVPTEIGLLDYFRGLWLYNNALTGWIPSEIGLLTFLEAVWLFNNHLTGTMPTEIGLLSNLVHLSLDYNTLTGQIPSEIALLTDLAMVWLHDNEVSGPIPLELDHLVLDGSLEFLALQNNRFSGTVSEALCSLGRFNPIFSLGLSFDCNDYLCGCCWCPCASLNATNSSSNCFQPMAGPPEWPGVFPTAADVITINVHTDYFQEETSLEWSVPDNTDGEWVTLNSIHPAEFGRLRRMEIEWGSLHNYSMEIESESLYKLELFDERGDGTCCSLGEGWFSVTNSTPSDDFKEGTVVWTASGDAFASYLVVFLWVDGEGRTQLVDSNHTV